MADAYYRISCQPVATLTSCGLGSANLPMFSFVRRVDNILSSPLDIAPGLKLRLQQVNGYCYRKETDSHTVVKELVDRAVSDPAALMAALGDPTRGGVKRLYVTDDLTILNIVWAPRMTLRPHNHNMWGG